VGMALAQQWIYRYGILGRDPANRHCRLVSHVPSIVL